jgi:hypothetical protein
LPYKDKEKAREAHKQSWRRLHRATHCQQGHNIESDDSVYTYISKQKNLIRRCKICYNNRPSRRAEALRENHLQRIFKVGLDYYNAVLREQSGGCAICGTNEPGGNQNRSFHFDHDRKCCPGKKTCGKCLRGLLCSECNTALGLVKENPERLHAMVAYIAKYAPPKGEL